MNIINALPGIVPTARTFTMGQWPQKRVKMRNGRTAHWGLCNKPSGDKMDLAWENITYAQAEQLCKVWDDNYGIYGSLSQAPSIPLTQEILAGTSGELKTLLALPFPNSSWHFAGPPRVEAVKARRCSVRIPIKLRAQAFYPQFQFSYDLLVNGSTLPAYGQADNREFTAVFNDAVNNLPLGSVVTTRLAKPEPDWPANGKIIVKYRIFGGGFATTPYVPDGIVITSGDEDQIFTRELSLISGKFPLHTLIPGGVENNDYVIPYGLNTPTRRWTRAGFQIEGNDPVGGGYGGFMPASWILLEGPEHKDRTISRITILSIEAKPLPANPPVPPLGGAQKLTLPGYTPTNWELTLPGYPVITANFRSASYPDILGSLPSESRWKLTYENMTSAEALALLLPWKGTGCGIWPLASLPAETAGGVDDEDFRKRLTGTTWAIEREPVMQSVKNGRFTVTIDLIHELAFESVYGPRNAAADIGLNPVRLNMSNAMSVVALATLPLPSLENADGVVSLTLESGLAIIESAPLSLPSLEDADAVLDLALESGLTTLT